ncbi:ATP synthase subunit O, mitochondrial [Bombina bombina]|uniref:ATP synthase subunit O, mitochondrial n=1 Tax=Bombina bombina TaxID=8345 RepID=UPI00235A587C|nr:ATP synthase subunit O, mitochondrial [Bombina bombina]
MAAAGRLSLTVRTFSTSAVRPVSKLVMPPVQVFGLGGRYATALYSAASKEKKLDQVEKELNRVATLVKDPKLAAVIANPHIKRALKQKAINDLMTKEAFMPLTTNFVNVLSENGRLPQTAAVLAAFAKIMSAHRGEVLCSVTTASPLDEASLTDLKTALNGFMAKGETLKLETKIDSSILGGMVVSIGDKYIDMSTKAKIHKLAKIMKETV